MMEEEEEVLYGRRFLKLKEPVLAGMEKMFPWLQIFMVWQNYGKHCKENYLIVGRYQSFSTNISLN